MQLQHSLTEGGLINSLIPLAPSPAPFITFRKQNITVYYDVVTIAGHYRDKLLRYFIADNKIELSAIRYLFTYVSVSIVTFVTKLAIIATFSASQKKKTLSPPYCACVARVPGVVWKNFGTWNYLQWRDFILRSSTLKN